jgi:hypothetical protein
MAGKFCSLVAVLVAVLLVDHIPALPFFCIFFGATLTDKGTYLLSPALGLRRQRWGMGAWPSAIVRRQSLRR